LENGIIGRILKLGAVTFLLFAIFFASIANAKNRITVFAAASMKGAVEAVSELYERQCDCTIVTSFGGSAILARQLFHGTPADIFISADDDWMKWLAKRNSIQIETSRNIAANRLVVAVGTDTDKNTDKNTDWGNLVTQSRIAIGDPRSVPAGRYAKAALQHAGLWVKVESRAVRTENVRVALALVARGEVAAAIVYASDLRVEPRVKSVHMFPSSAHPPIRYPAALVSNARSHSKDFLDFLGSSAAKSVFNDFGFKVEPEN